MTRCDGDGVDARRRADRQPHRDLGRGRRRLAGGALARRRAGPRRPRAGRARSAPARASRDLRHRRYRARRGPTASRCRASRRSRNSRAPTSPASSRRAHGKPPPAPFRYRNVGNLATIGRREAVVDFGWLRLSGRLAWLLWSVAHIYFLIGFRNRLAVAIDWLWSYLTYQRGARLITGDPDDDTATRASRDCPSPTPPARRG